MRALLVVVLVVSGLWAGYWVVGSRTVESSVETWFAAPGEGVVATRSDVSVQGFPNRFDLTVTNPAIAIPEAGWAWRAPFAQVFTMTWKPWHVIAALAPEQEIDTPSGSFRLTSSQLEGSLVVTPGTALALDRTVVSGEGLHLADSNGWEVAGNKATLATRRMPDDPNAHEIGFDASTLTPDAGFRMALAGRSDLPEQIDQVRLDAVLTLTAPLDRFAADTRPQLAGVRIRHGLVRWGDLSVSAEGEVFPAADGTAEGRIDLRITNWRKLVPVLVAAGIVTVDVAPTVERAMELLAEQGPDPMVLTVPLSFQSGMMSLGPLPLGPAPRFAQRQ